MAPPVAVDPKPLTDRIAALEADLQAREAERALFLNSTSWRITAPLRAVRLALSRRSR